jgi:ABC-2 type transport system permease protein
MFSTIDFRQVLILTRYALTSEWRRSSTRSFGRQRKMSRSWAYWTIVIYLVIGAFSLRLFVENTSGEAFVTAVAVFMLYGALVIASNIFMSFGTGFLSPDEAQIISLMPVSSDTFFFSRLAVLICYTTVISLLLSIGPFIGLEFFLREGSASLLAQNLMFVVIMVLSGIAASMTVIVLYGILLSKLGKSRVSKVAGYVQFVGSFISTMSIVVLSQVRHSIDLHPFTLDTQPWIAFIPSYWFASLATLGSGLSSAIHLPLALASLAFLAILAFASHVLLGKKYQSEVEELTASAAMSAKQKKSDRDSFLYRVATRLARSDEAHATFQVLRAQFRYDSKFRMQLLASFAPTFIYLVVAIVLGGIIDPFGENWRGIIRSNMFYIMAILMPLISMQSISQSENFKAAWIFFASPVDRSKLLLAVRNAIFVSIIVPYMIILTAVLSYYMPVFHAIAHALVLAAIAGLIFQCYMMLNPKMPFAQQRRPNRGGFVMAAGIGLLVPISMGLLALVIYFGYRSQARFWPILAIMLTISALLERLVHIRIRRKLEREEFDG